MLANPFQSSSSTLSTLIPNPADGSQFYKFNTGLFQTFTYDELEPGWVPNGNTRLEPGEGGFFRNNAAASLNVCFAGAVKTGRLLNALPTGFAIRSSIVPRSGTPAELGIPARDGDQIYLFSNGHYNTFTYDGLDEAWLPFTPTIGSGGTFFIRKNSAADWIENHTAP